jgi:hypothetical protein
LVSSAPASLQWLFGGFGQERAITSGKRSAGLPAGEAQILTNVGAVWFVLGQNKQTNSKASTTKAAWNCSAFIGKTGQEPTWFFFCTNLMHNQQPRKYIPPVPYMTSIIKAVLVNRKKNVLVSTWICICTTYGY